MTEKEINDLLQKILKSACGERTVRGDFYLVTAKDYERLAAVCDAKIAECRAITDGETIEPDTPDFLAALGEK